MIKKRYIALLMGALLLTGCSQNTNQKDSTTKSSTTAIDYNKLSKKDKQNIKVEMVSNQPNEYDAAFTNNTGKTVSINLSDLKVNGSTQFNTNLSKFQLNPKQTIYVRRLISLGEKVDDKAQNITLGGTQKLKINTGEKDSNTDTTKPNTPIDVSNIQESDWIAGIPSFLNGTYRSELVDGEYFMMKFNQAENEWAAYIEPEGSMGNVFNGLYPEYYRAKEDKNVYFIRDLKSKGELYMKITNLGNNTFLRGPIMGELKDDPENTNTYKYKPDTTGGN